MSRVPHNSVVYIVDPGTDGMEDKVLVLTSLPLGVHDRKRARRKPPGGEAKRTGPNETGPWEDPEATSKREVREETGIKIRKKTRLNPLGAVGDDVGHVKYGFWVLRSECRGSLSKKVYFDGKTKVIARRWMTISAALRVIRPKGTNSSHNDFLRVLQEIRSEQKAPQAIAC